MYSHSHHRITAEHNGADMLVTAHSPGENPLSLATERAAELYGLLLMASDYNASGEDLGALSQETRESLLSLAGQAGA